MASFGLVIQTSVQSILETWQDLSLGRAVARELVSDHHTRCDGLPLGDFGGQHLLDHAQGKSEVQPHGTADDFRRETKEGTVRRTCRGHTSSMPAALHSEVNLTAPPTHLDLAVANTFMTLGYCSSGPDQKTANVSHSATNAGLSAFAISTVTL